MKSPFNIGVMLCILSLLFGCFSSSYQSPLYVKLAHKITEEAAKELKVQKDLFLIGTGGQMMHDIQMMAMSFNYYQEMDLKTARELLIYVIDEYLSAINSNKEIRPYLHEYPFTAKNVEIRIFIYNPDKSELPLEKIDCITSLNGALSYYTRSDPHQAICTESYEEASQEIALSQEGLIEEVGQTEDRKCSEKATFIEIMAKDGAKVNIKVTSLEYSMFQLIGKGFKPYEPMNFVSNSCGEIIYAPIKADGNGNLLPIGLLPAVIGKSGGVCYIDILRNEGPIQIKLPWGTEILKNN